MTVQRAHVVGVVLLPADYVREHVELAYASTAHRAQGRTVDTAHALVSPTTTREVLYVSGTRGREGNWLYVDTHYDPDPQTSHDQVTEVATAREVLAGVLRNEGVDVAAHDMIRRAQSEAEGMERLSAEYITLARQAQAERWDALLARSGLTQTEVDAVQAAEARGPLFAAFREAEAAGLDVEAVLPQLVTGRSLTDAVDVAAVLHGRVHRWTEAARGTRHRGVDHLIAGLIPRVRRVTDPDMASALAEREQAMETRARTLASHAVETGQTWVQRLGPIPADPRDRTRWFRKVSTIAAYRDGWHITGSTPIGTVNQADGTERMSQFRRAHAAAEHARAITQGTDGNQTSVGPEVEIEVVPGVEL
jgi:hypothetical protein